jgi:hypothetical protein
MFLADRIRVDPPPTAAKSHRRSGGAIRITRLAAANFALEGLNRFAANGSRPAIGVEKPGANCGGIWVVRYNNSVRLRE